MHNTRPVLYMYVIMYVGQALPYIHTVCNCMHVLTCVFDMCGVCCVLSLMEDMCIACCKMAMVLCTSRPVLITVRLGKHVW